MKNKKIKMALIIILSVVVLLLAGSVIAVNVLTYKAGSAAQEAMKGNAEVSVEDKDIISFEKKDTQADTGVIFYPGALVAPEAYAPWALEIAQTGTPVYIVKMPFNLAVLSPNKGKEVITQHPEIAHFIIGGHSLGGAMAPELGAKEEKIQGVFFLAAYPQNDELKNTHKKVFSIWGSNDGVAKLDKVKGAQALYPQDAVMLEIKGGNHAGFGDYGDQKGDNKADISNEEQMNEAAQAVISLLKEVNQ